MDNTHPLPAAAPTNDIIDTRVAEDVRALLGSKFAFTLQTYLYDAHDWIEALARAASDQEIDRIILASHALRVSSLYIGAARMMRLAAMSEALGHQAAKAKERRRSAYDFKGLVRQLRKSLAETEKAFAAYNHSQPCGYTAGSASVTLPT